MSRLGRCAVTAALAVLAVVSVASSAAAAGSKRFEPLNQYLVGKVDPETLARAGFDMHEAFVKGTDGKLAIVATQSQAAKLRDQGATVEAPFGVARALAQAPSPLQDPTHGYDVFRPWSLTPAPCPTTCATPNVNLKTYYQHLADANGDVVQRFVYGHSVLGQQLVAYRVTNERSHKAKNTVLYDAVQHAREWIAAETERRLFAYVLEHKRDKDFRRLLRNTELWFVPIVNPDGYDYTFQSKATRLWRKNLHDNDGDGAITNVDGVDTNRNWPTRWNYDLEGSSADLSNETYHGAGPASEPEVAALRGLERRLDPIFQIDYHSFAQLILYPEGWQVETPAADVPLMAALAGDDDHPAVAGFDPDVSAELYTTNGDITDDGWHTFGTQAYTVELDGGTGDPVGGTDGGDGSPAPGGFVYQDREADVAAEAEKNFAFALDLAKSAKKPDKPVSHLGNTAPDFVPTTFGVSFGNPQTVQVNAKKSLGSVRAFWQINGGRPTYAARTSEFTGGQRDYGEPGTYYHNLRARVTGTRPGDTVKVWFGSRHRKSDSFTYTVRSDSNRKVLILAAEDYTGNSSLRATPGPYPGPAYLDTFKKALDDAGIGYDVYDVDAEGRKAPTALGVLSHYKAVLWYTGDDLYVREPTQPGGTGTQKLFDDEILATRDFMNEGGKLLVTGQTALQGAWDQFLWNPLGPPPAPFCASNQTQGNGDADDPPGQNFNCVAASNDFLQYWLGAWLPITVAADPDAAAALPFLGAGGAFNTAFTVNGEDSAKNQQNTYSMLTTSSILNPDTYPQFQSSQAIKLDRPPAFDPTTGSWYAFSQSSDQSYKRLMRTVDLTGTTNPKMSFQISYDTEQDWDYVFVEVHPVGSDAWTTLPDANGNTTQDTGFSCPAFPYPTMHPQLAHYETYTGPSPGGETDPDPSHCIPTGTTGAWNGATGNSGGWQSWSIDLSAYAGQQVEVSISTVTDAASHGLGVFVDDVNIADGATTLASTSFEDDLGGFTVPGNPPGSPGNVDDWIRSQSVGYVDGPGVQTDHSLLWGFGLEGVTGADTRAKLVKEAMTSFGVTG
jgi:hypothetical protein